MNEEYRVSEDKQNQSPPLSREGLIDSVRLFQEQGYLVLNKALSQTWVESLATAYHSDFGGLALSELSEYGYLVGDQRILHPLPLKGVFNQPEFYAQPMLYTLLMTLLGPKMVLNNCAVVVSLPGSENQRLHRDTPFLFGRNPASALIPPYGITLGIPLVDLNEVNGSTCFYSVSHRALELAKTYQERGNGTSLQCTMGDVYLMDFRLVHAGTANLSPSRRPIIYLAYTQPWYFDIENTINQRVPSVVISENDLQNIPEQYAQLLSYSKVIPRDMKSAWQKAYRQGE